MKRPIPCFVSQSSCFVDKQDRRIRFYNPMSPTPSRKTNRPTIEDDYINNKHRNHDNPRDLHFISNHTIETGAWLISHIQSISTLGMNS